MAAKARGREGEGGGRQVGREGMGERGAEGRREGDG